MNEQQYELARKKVARLKAFYQHALHYLVINLVLIAINLLVDPDYLWFYWVSIFWGLGIVLEGIHVYFWHGPMFGKTWEEKKIRELMDKK